VRLFKNDKEFFVKNTPDFICIGMQKAGTTWLAANLGRHPSAWIPSIKEIHYFDETHTHPGWHKRRLGESLFLRKLIRGIPAPKSGKLT
jgi:hypothetical protein